MKQNESKKNCCKTEESCFTNSSSFSASSSSQDVACCGSLPGPKSGKFERPGYHILSFVEDFIETPAGRIPRIKTKLNKNDFLGTIKARLGIYRDNYKISPGLYCVGTPDLESPVIATANYKLSFDSLRKELTGISAWILVLDTRGINVWCAAGKDLFSTAEVIHMVNLTQLKKVTESREIILPQLSATGVSARKVKKGCGFTVVWGPVKASDLKSFMKNEMTADKKMRQVTFSFYERLVLVPVELAFIIKPTLWAIMAFVFLSFAGAILFSIESSLLMCLIAFTAYIGGIIAGAVATPAFLPWLPGRAFSLKGMITGILFSLGIILFFWSSIDFLKGISILFVTTAISSFLAMNFTGSTPFTSPTGVEKEMRRAIPLQAIAVFFAVAIFLGSVLKG
jgi:hypothetical protein